MNKVIRKLWTEYPKTSEWEQGFIDQFGEFYNRREAMVIAIAGGQEIDIKRGCGGDAKILYSEGSTEQQYSKKCYRKICPSFMALCHH